MRFLLVNALLGLLLAPSAQAGWREFGTKDPKPQLLTPPRVEARIEGHEVVVRVTNVSARKISYSGYSRESPATYREEKRLWKWHDDEWPWCGTGMEPRVLRPKETVVFRFLRGSGRFRQRIYTRFYAEDGQQSLVLLWEGR